MKCHTIKKLLYLRDEELTPRARRKVLAHVAACELCRLEKQRLAQHMVVTAKLQQQPLLENPAALTNSIMTSVRNMQKFARRRSNPLDKLLDVLARRPVRLAFAGTLFLIIGFFVVQEMLVLQRLDHLEQRLAQHDLVSLQNQVVSAPKSMLSLFGKKEQVVIDKKVLDEFLQSYGELEMKNRLLLEMLEQQAERADITWQDGLTQQELESLLKNKAVQQKLKEL